ncbi:hypothetical protein BLL04_24450 [Klebsiella variicola]|nr:hypothetical protein BLL04_24450 [Klebsiella variicola]
MKTVRIAQGKGGLFVKVRRGLWFFACWQRDITSENFQHRLGGIGARQRVRHPIIAQGMGELAQNIEMLVVLSRDTDNQIGGLLLTPVNPLRTSQHLNTRFEHCVATVRRAVGNSDAVAQIGADLPLALAHAL